MRRSQDRRFGPTAEHGVRSTWFGEVSVQGSSGRQTWVGGAAFQQDRHALRELPQFDYSFSSPSVFMQDEIAITRKLTLAVSARADVHSEYGVLATPRISLLSRPASGWTVRVAAGTGAFAPTPFTEETEETGLSRLRPLRGLRAERARNTSLDVTRVFGSIEVTGTVFGSVVRHPVVTRTLDVGDVEFLNAPESTRTGGTELLLRYRREGFVALATHAWTRSTEFDADEHVRRAVPLTPAHAGSLNAIWEDDEWGRFGIEMYSSAGRSSTRIRIAMSAGRICCSARWRERRFGGLRVFLNAENLLDVRQTKYDPLTVPGRGATAAGRSMRGRRSKGASSTAACASRSDVRDQPQTGAVMHFDMVPMQGLTTCDFHWPRPPSRPAPPRPPAAPPPPRPAAPPPRPAPAARPAAASDGVRPVRRPRPSPTPRLDGPSFFATSSFSTVPRPGRSGSSQ